MADRERIAELLVEPSIEGMDFAYGSCILNNWKEGLPDRILALIKQLGYTRPGEPAEDKVEAITEILEILVAMSFDAHHGVKGIKHPDTGSYAREVLKHCWPKLTMLSLEDKEVKLALRFWRQDFSENAERNFAKRLLQAQLTHDQDTLKGIGKE